MAAQRICKGCGQPISGSYITALGAAWHPEHFVCFACHRPIDDAQFNMHEGAPYHSECYLNRIAPRCAYCHKPITGQYYTHQGSSYHAECYRDHVVPRCAYCGKPLISRYQVDYWGTKYCQEHQNEYPKCAFCGRLVPPQQQEPGTKGKELVRCPICRTRAVETLDRARPLFQDAIQRLNAQGLHYNNVPLGVELVDRAALAQLLNGRSGADALGVTKRSTHMLNGQVVSTEVDGIAILRGLPAALFRGVCTHELGHAWLTLQGIRGLPSWAEEGFCELLSYHFYQRLNTEESRYHIAAIEESRDPVYGEGFRRVRAIADRRGFQKFVESLKTTKRLPSG
jgi:DNA-directed RNA polymerase subunit RPC12/RpoP